MRKYILTISLVIVSLGVFAQIPAIGVKGGVNFATVTYANSTNFKSSSLATFNAGVFVDFKFGNLSLQPALNYTGEGGTHTEMYSVPVALGGNGSGNTETIKESLYYLQLPVNLVFHIPVVVGNIYFGAGPYIAQGLSGKRNSQNVVFGNSANDYDSNDIKPTQFGADAIIGFKFKGGFLVNANYDLGLSNDVPSSQSGSSHSHVFGVSIGYVFL